MTQSGHLTDPPPAWFRALFEQAGDSVLIARCPTGEILEANPKAQESLARTALQLASLSLSDLVEADSALDFTKLSKQAAGADKVLHFTGKLLRQDMSSFPAELDLRNLDGGYFLVTFRDISERVRALEDIELRNIAIANVTSGVTVADARQPDLPLIYVNRGFQEITGYSAREAVGRSCRFLQGDDRDQAELETLRQALREGQPCVVQLRNYKKDGTLFYNELHISPIRNEAGELTHFVGIQLDVTEQVRALESLERSEARYRQALEQEKELNDFKTRFISMVSHEFRTPMTGIQASAALLRKFG
ncbi:MAG TPA: PAS domain-containing protein, partial [Oceanipulchritudo sp.]|nr:PAS domain-containing protein [Oceanipulchritudo sp.]